MGMGFPINEETQKQFERIEAGTRQYMKDRIEIDTHFFFHSDLLNPILENSNTLVELRGIITKSVISAKIGMSDCIKEVKGVISGSNLYKRDMDWDIKDLVNSFYSINDAVYNRLLGAGFNFRYFIYQGGIIDDSRDFCVAHNDMVWSVEEAEDWAIWTPGKGLYPDGYQIKQKDISAIPSYLGYPGYIPLIDRGGFNCCHFIGWIPDDLAFKQRPDLKGGYDQTK
ncbi:MAG: hypothetical protein A2V64_10965 [Bacteroidetes bacterium RBG_13_43_22]|nr:MAG: hypothetical protein A2V64_10965 [Bacteroidetes bacterium RBG_13_43_22]OFY73513.1 MAG: hypothetical protein A2V46_06540 [Bacteroidetes bacterium RBG_19FT_COMBO_42_7]